MNSLGLGPPVQWLSDMGRSILSRAPTVGGVPGSARLGAASAAATAAALAAGAFSLGATSTLATATAIAAELYEATGRGGLGVGGGAGPKQKALLGRSTGLATANPDTGTQGAGPKSSSFADESSVDPFSHRYTTVP